MPLCIGADSSRLKLPAGTGLLTLFGRSSSKKAATTPTAIVTTTKQDCSIGLTKRLS